MTKPSKVLKLRVEYRIFYYQDHNRHDGLRTVTWQTEQVPITQFETFEMEWVPASSLVNQPRYMLADNAFFNLTKEIEDLFRKRLACDALLARIIGGKRWHVELQNFKSFNQNGELTFSPFIVDQVTQEFNDYPYHLMHLPVMGVRARNHHVLRAK